MAALGIAQGRFSTSKTTKSLWLKFAVVEGTSEVEALIGRNDLDRLGFSLKASDEVPNSESMPKPPEPPEPPEPQKEVVKRVLKEPLGLPADFFQLVDPMQDQEFKTADDMYPAVTQTNVANRVTHQASMVDQGERLIEELMSGAQALQEYPSGCPPPCLVKPITPPLKPDAQLLYVNQAPRSRADREFMENYVATRLKYRIDEAGHANANVPVFSIPKPDTDDR
ncbi:hypothetical protein IWQ62_003967 [Dispira parvispora]|uniref:Uncharacterized protein n=1 Tax=Dispira parvispora TaxID=1520584 RepID=A0A9W8ALV8_9FUNG|nr:hypothetical protein IWQ62_003967 [Dispira parvispora]